MNDKEQKGGIIDLLVENYKKVKKLHVVLVMGINEITGPNGAGKSSGLDAVANIFGGKKLTPPEPINEGAKGFKLQVTLPKLGLKITRLGKLREDGTLKEDLIVENADGLAAGAALGRPQELLDKVLHGHSVTLKSLMEMPIAERIAVMRKVTGLDFTELDAEREAVYAERTAVNNATKALHARLEGMSTYTDAPDELVSVSDLMTELNHQTEINKGYDVQRKALQAIYDQVIKLEEQRNGILQQIEILKEQALQKAEERDADIALAKPLEKKVDNLIDFDLGKIQCQISDADSINEKVRANVAYAKVEADYAESTTDGNTLTNRLKEIDKKKADDLAGAKFPVKGLSFDSEYIYLNKKPLEQASQVELMNLDIAIAIAQDPDVPIILVNKGSLYDKGHRKELDRMAKEKGVFVGFERVLDTLEDAEKEGVAVFMEDGVGIVIGEEK